ncbi:MAG: hypothetical protein KA190_21500, partial [Kofleriaceae bacterium]|nr:hypothetical protein [Kofleriaceae bacterium]
LPATLVDQRLARSIEAHGSIDPARTAEALTLVRAKLDELATAGPATALAFVAARRRVLARLRAVSTAAGAMADQVEGAVARGRDLRTELVLADEVARLTLDQVGTLRQLAPARASVLVLGPQVALDAAATALGVTLRKP